MDIQMLRKNSIQLRFVFLTTSIIISCVSLLFLDQYYLNARDSKIKLSLPKLHNEKHEKIVTTTPSNSSSNFTTTCNLRNVTKGAINISTSIGDEGNRRRNVVSSHPLVKEKVQVFTTKKLDHCLGKYIYMYDLPSRFNEDLLKKCRTLNRWENICPHLSNLGLGLEIIEELDTSVLSNENWFATNQFSLELIFHNIMKHYRCLTNDSSLASAIYVPYYVGLDIGRYLWGGFNISVRDESPKKLMKWLAQRPEWKKLNGKDHFLVGGRVGFDFRRRSDENEDWGTKFMFFPGASNMSILLIESCGFYGNEFAIPYPTYFHPRSDDEILDWQNKVRKIKRNYMFTFAGAPRPNSTSSIRNELIEQCVLSPNCKLADCNKKQTCGDPNYVMKVFKNSVFCLQPPGDSYTRRSIFDSILAGCIPVFFHPQSAYKQYVWHFPKNTSTYSIFIPEIDVKEKRVKIDMKLLNVSTNKVLAMREEVIKLIPKIIYRYPSSRLKTHEDAFDVAIKGVLGRVEAMRKEITSSSNITVNSV
ncbi:unnamed protein product [Vicia faba]|uniref:Exostosin GT47 domain-containing protein n=1 Tax=Vicia faba TaxID=3906 RepID=A0AAV0YME1_VICFA|nr:unnamed protein product [Vicia faba]